MGIDRHHVSLATFAFVLLVACADTHGDAPGAAPDSGTTSSGSGDTSGAGGIGGVGGVGGAVAGVGGVGGVTGVGGDFAGDPCPSPAIAREAGTGLAAADFNAQTLHVRPTTTLDGTRLAIGPLLYPREGGLLVRGQYGFWEIERDGEPIWFDTSRELEDLLLADLDGDDDLDVVTIEQLDSRDSANHKLVTDGGVEYAYLLTTWERVEDELIARAQQPAHGRPGQYALADLDGDADADLVTFDGGDVIVQRNEGELAFTHIEASARVEGHTGASRSFAMLIADRNGDAIQDLVVLSPGVDSASSDVLVFLADGEGQLLPPTNTKLEALTAHRGALGDVTGDGLADAVMQGTLSKDDGTSEEATFLIESLSATSVSEPRSLGDVVGAKLVDFDADGALDIVGSSAFGELTIDIALGAGAFERRRFYLAAHDLQDFLINPPRDGEVAQFVGLYRFVCQEPCTNACSQCVFDACLPCVTPEGGLCPSAQPSDDDDDDDAGTP